ncbi:MAG: hypothetical protein E5Y85_12125 [Mesorhizobium sp.]|nr:MAG: hypothetical protein E5Y85_12125 [Mesorhizobium sp.]
MLAPGAQVEHADFGRGAVVSVLGTEAEVDFFGEVMAVKTAELTPIAASKPKAVVKAEAMSESALAFRKAFEAVNLGVTPSAPEQLIGLTIDGAKEERRIVRWLERAPTDGLCKVFFGGYGTGKSHHLQLVKATALRDGWVTAFVEFDPKAADPAKPQLVYRELMLGLEFPTRADGSQVRDFFGLVKEVRDHWAEVRSGKLLRSSPWFSETFRILQNFAHSEDDEYRQAMGWLPAFSKDASALKRFARSSGISPKVLPKMPVSKETAEIYVFHLVVLNEVCRSLGYKGLALILDEAEHVRGYNVRRKVRANNLFDLLARAAHAPVARDAPPARNDHELRIPEFWKTGPHFALFVGLTEGDTFVDTHLPLRDACVFLHDDNDRIMLKPPQPAAYRGWCDEFFQQCARHLGPLPVLGEPDERARIVAVLGDAFSELAPAERVLRIWIKLATLAPAILMCGRMVTVDALVAELKAACDAATGLHFPWDG